MLGKGWQIYNDTRKKHDLVFNVYLMRPIAALLVALLTPSGGIIAIAVLEASYCLDCVDGMLARHKKIASKEGHLFDFFTDELKALLLAALLGVRLWRTGGLGLDAQMWPA